MDVGVVYFASGRRYIEEAIASASSVKLNSPGVSTCLITLDRDCAGDGFDKIFYVDPDQDYKKFFLDCNRIDSIKLFYLNRIELPFEYSLYLDSDTYVCGDLKPLFRWFSCRSADLAIARNAHLVWGRVGQQVELRGIYGITSPELAFNAGVLLFRRSAKTAAFFRDWMEVYKAQCEGAMEAGNYVVSDQGCLCKLLTSDTYSGVAYVEMENWKYNCQAFIWIPLQRLGMWRSVVVLHSHRVSEMKGGNVDELLEISVVKAYPYRLQFLPPGP